MGAGAPLPAQITQEALFPDLSVWIIGECTGRQQCRLATRAMEKMCKDLAWAEDKLFDVKPPIKAELPNRSVMTKTRLCNACVPDAAGGHGD